MTDEFERLEQELLARRDLTRAQPPVDVTAVSPRHGASRVSVRGRPTEEVISPVLWHVGQGPLEPGKLRLVLEGIGEASSPGFLTSIPPGAVFRTQARLLRSPSSAEGLICGAIEVIEPDKVFADALQRQKSPPTFTDPVLGTFTADEIMGWTGKANWLGHPCRISLSQPENAVIAHALWADQHRWTSAAIQCATEHLLSLKNDVWLDESEAPVSAANFGQRLSLIEIAIEAEGTFAFDFDDGDLFFGHTLTVQGSLASGFTKANIAG